MASHFRSVAIIPAFSAVPRDAVQNTFAWRSDATVDAEDAADEIAARLALFYGAINGVSMYSSQVNPDAIALKIYDYAEAAPRIPFREEVISAGSPATTGYDLPGEVAIVCTLEGARTSGVNMRRRRGRIYVGPLQVGVGDNALVPTSFQDAVADAAEANLLGSTGGPYLLDAAVYSRSTHFGKAVGEVVQKGDVEVPANLDASFVKVTRIWVDDAWDTQRRRGVGDTSRDVRTA